jgi:hypothetical protein
MDAPMGLSGIESPDPKRREGPRPVLGPSSTRSRTKCDANLAIQSIPQDGLEPRTGGGHDGLLDVIGGSNDHVCPSRETLLEDAVATLLE